MKIIPDKISSKVWLIVVIFSLTFMGMVLQSFITEGKIQKELDSFSVSSKITNSASRNLIGQLDSQFNSYQDAVVSGESDLIDEAAHSANIAEVSLDELKSIASPPLQERFNRFAKKHKNFTRLATKIYPKLMGEDASDEVYEKSAELAQEKTSIRKESIAITVALSDELSGKMDSLVAEIGRSKTKRLVIALTLIIAIVLSVAFVVQKHIATPFYDFIKQVEVLTEGNLTVRFAAERQGELSQLGRNLNHYVERLTLSIQKISSDANQLKTLSSDTQTSAEEMQTNSDEMSQQATSVNKAGEGLSTEIASISGNAEEMTSSTISVAGAIEEMSAAIAEVAQQCTKQSAIVEEANSKAKSANNLMEELGTAAQEIQKIIEMINTIAAQTNLLALNATIEAASAGEAGKGFAVVANEVKELARQSSDSSERIGTQIHNIREKTEASLKAVGEISEIMEQVSMYSNMIASSIEEQSATNQEISGTMQTVSRSTEEVSETVKRSSESAHSVAENIRGVNDSISRFKILADHTQTRSLELSDLSNELHTAVNQFKTK